MKPYTLKLDSVKRKAREAYKAGLLTAQAPYMSDRRCIYSRACADGVDRHCAIGAALPQRVLKAIAENNKLDQSVDDLVGTKGYIQFVTIEERSAIMNIQSVHDTWCRLSSQLQGPTAEAKFKQAIGLK